MADKTLDGRAREAVLITGSSGFIGAALARRLARRYRVLGLDKGPPAEQSDGVAFVPTALTDAVSVKEAIRRASAIAGLRFASVVHLAAYFDLTGKPNEKYTTVTLRGSERLLEALRDFEVEQFVFSSTMLVHAPTQRGAPINEDSPLDDSYPYRRSKLQTEELIRKRRGDMPTVFPRPAGVYDDEGHSPFLTQQMARIYERRLTAHVYPGDLSSGQPYLHLDDRAPSEAAARYDASTRRRRRHEL
jgi:nucleoside-diphosphate-sugar epimerase